MLPGRTYILRSGSQHASASVSTLKYKLNVDNLEHQAGKNLELNEVGFCNLSLDRPLVFDPYKNDRDMGGFILIDRLTNRTVGAGMIEFGLRRATNIQWQKLDIDKSIRAELKGQKPCVLWFTGLSGSGKSTVASLLEKQLHASGRHTYVLDGDNVRHGLNKDLGFTDADRVENIRRVAETARLFVDAGLIVVVSFICAVPVGAADGARAVCRGRVHGGLSSTPRWKSARRAIRKAFTKRRARARSRTSPASIPPTKFRTGRTSSWRPASTRRTTLVADLMSSLQKKGFI